MTLMENDFRKLNDMMILDTDHEWDNHFNYFSNSNVVVNALVKKIQYKEHWGPLSIKCAFKGQEHYHSKNFFYTVNDSNFLIFNEGIEYASFIDSKTEVESFTIHFSPLFEQRAAHALLATDSKLLDDPFFVKDSNIQFSQRLYAHNDKVSPLLFKIRDLAREFDSNVEEIAETYFYLFSAIVASQTSLNQEIMKIDALRLSTKRELFRRLCLAYDYISSKFRENVTLDEIAAITCMNQFYLLRQFKKYFHITPHQLLLKFRMEEAFRLLTETQRTATDICNELGFGDLASFSKIFKKNFSHSPQHFKDRLEKS